MEPTQYLIRYDIKCFRTMDDICKSYNKAVDNYRSEVRLDSLIRLADADVFRLICVAWLKRDAFSTHVTPDTASFLDIKHRKKSCVAS